MGKIKKERGQMVQEREGDIRERRWELGLRRQRLRQSEDLTPEDNGVFPRAHLFLSERRGQLTPVGGEEVELEGNFKLKENINSNALRV